MKMTIARKLLALNLLAAGLFLALIGLQFLQLRDVVQSDREQLVRTQTESAVAIAAGFADRAAAGEMTEDEAKAQAVEAISAMRYGDNDYVFVTDTKAKMIAHPNGDLIGQTLWDMADPNGVLLFQDLIARAAEGGGFTPYLWPRAGDEEPVAKISYAAPFAQWDWVVGTGVYTDDIVTQVRGETLKMAGWLAGILFVLVAAGLLLARSVTRPLAGLAASIERIGLGHVREEIESVSRHDEIGEMAAKVDGLRQSLVEKEELEAEQARLREQAEAERQRRAADDARHEEEREARRKQDEQREAEQAAAEEAARREAEEERVAREAEQEHVVALLAAGLKRLSSGELNVEIAEVFPESYEQLRTDFNATVASLAELIRSIGASTESITTNVQEITGAATDLSRRTENTAATLEETAAALNELTASVASAADGARQADALVKTTNDEARTSSQVVRDAVEAMGAIEKSSNQIAKIIDVIDDIAFQTNLLALNAGVEAARAGDAGRGFAVVASEVRALAQRSSDAAREINTLISDSGSQVKHGVDLVGRAGEALQAIVTSINEISSHVGSIAVSADEQATGINEINSAMAQLDQATQQNVAMFEETTAASTSLNNEAQTLAALVERFDVSKQSSNTVVARPAFAA